MRSLSAAQFLHLAPVRGINSIARAAGEDPDQRLYETGSCVTKRSPLYKVTLGENHINRCWGVISASNHEQKSD